MQILILTNVNFSQAKKEAIKNDCRCIVKIDGGYLIATDKVFFEVVKSTILENKL